MDWHSEKKSGPWLGDKPLSAVTKALSITVDAYEKEFGRPPDTIELRNLLTECLMAMSPRIGDGDQLHSVKIHSKKRTPGRVTVKVGDVFYGYFPGKHFYGRVIAETQLGTLLEFFDVPQKRLLTFTQLRLRQPARCRARFVHRGSFFSQPQWHVIGNLRVEKDYEYPTFFLIGGTLCHPTKPSRDRPATTREIRELEPVVLYGGESISENLVKYGYKRTWPDTTRLRKEAIARFEASV